MYLIFLFSQGEELYSNYGDLSNEKLLFAYGFAIENNPYDAFMITMRRSVEAEDPSNKGKSFSTYITAADGIEGIPMVIYKFWENCSIILIINRIDRSCGHFYHRAETHQWREARLMELRMSRVGKGSGRVSALEVKRMKAVESKGVVAWR